MSRSPLERVAVETPIRSPLIDNGHSPKFWVAQVLSVFAPEQGDLWLLVEEVLKVSRHG